MTYKDKTFCHDWCNNTKCHRNYAHILEAKDKGDIPDWMLISFFVAIPLDCNEYIAKEGK